MCERSIPCRRAISILLTTALSQWDLNSNTSTIFVRNPSKGSKTGPHHFLPYSIPVFNIFYLLYFVGNRRCCCASNPWYCYWYLIVTRSVFDALSPWWWWRGLAVLENETSFNSIYIGVSPSLFIHLNCKLLYDLNVRQQR